MSHEVVVDVAGGGIGGAARWREELAGFLAQGVPGIRTIGDGRPFTAGWLVRRELRARGADVVVAPNNASFAVSGTARVVLLRNPLHFILPGEEEALGRMSRSFRAQIPVVHRLLSRADRIVVPCSPMRDRVLRHVPAAAGRMVVRAHPVTPVGPRRPAPERFILVPVVPGPYKNLPAQLEVLVEALDWVGDDISVRVTADPADLPPRLAHHPRVTTVGVVPHRSLAELWREAAAAFFPCTVEAFGYPLAEARAYGVPVLAPDSRQAREVAGPALRGYDLHRPDSIAAALESLSDAVQPEPGPFDRDEYFRWLLRVHAPVPVATAGRVDGSPS